MSKPSPEPVTPEEAKKPEEAPKPPDPEKLPKGYTIERFWARMVSETKAQPHFDRAKLEFRLNGPNAKSAKVCGLYVIYKDHEYCYLVAQEVLDESTHFGTMHIVVLQMLIDDLGVRKSKPKFDFLAGFYYDAGERKCNSSANTNYVGSQALPESMRAEFEARVFPKIEDKLRTVLTVCQGFTRKVAEGSDGKKKPVRCRRLVLRGLYCPAHRNQQK